MSPILSQVSGAIYSGGPDWDKYSEFLTQVYGKFIWSNPLHTSMFPDVRQLEAWMSSLSAPFLVIEFCSRLKLCR